MSNSIRFTWEIDNYIITVCDLSLFGAQRRLIREIHRICTDCKRYNQHKYDSYPCLFPFKYPKQMIVFTIRNSNPISAISLNSYCHSIEIKYKKIEKHDVLEFNSDDCCCICLDLQKDTCYIPCGHLCVCYKCSLKITSCPICRIGMIPMKIYK